MSERLAAAASVQPTLLSFVRASHASTVAAYVPVGPEPGGADLPSVLAEALRPNGRLLLPVLLNDNDLDWAAYAGTLEAGPRGLQQPPGPRLGVEAVRTAQVVVVPALAVDRAGHRLGRGGGSYDRVLARLASAPPAADPPTADPPAADSPAADPPTAYPPADLSLAPRAAAQLLVVALLHDGEFVDVVPAEPHDHPVDAIITPSGGLALRRVRGWTK